MADHTISISNSINCFGAGPASKWNEFDWGVGFWGEGSEDLIQDITKVIGNSTAITTAVFRNFIKSTIYNTISMDVDMESEQLFGGNDYNYVFTAPTVEAEDRSETKWITL